MRVPGASAAARREDTRGERLASSLPLGRCLAPRGRHHPSVLRGTPPSRERSHLDGATSRRDAK
eukprot:4432155-Alexandrium_andersonii.AAC.1